MGKYKPGQQTHSQQKSGSHPQYFKHKHCTLCGLPVQVNKTFCGPTCEQKTSKMNKRKNYTMIFTMIMFPLLLVVMLLFSGRG